MLQLLKVWAFRWWYRLSSYLAWRKFNDGPAGTGLNIPTGNGTVPARSYTGASGSEHPLIVYFHGGGWLIGDLNTHDHCCRALARHTGCSVVAIDYRLAPEHPYPAAHDDCLAATHWLAESLPSMPPCDGRIILAGDSAGGNLAVCSALEADERARKTLAGVLSIYPVTDHYSADFGSYTERATGQLLTRDLMQWFWDTYLGDTGPDDAMRARPLLSENLAQLPPLMVVTAERDPLRDEGAALAQRCRDTGVPVDYRHYGDAEHGFACSEGETADFLALMDQLKQWLEDLPPASVAA